jgi:O-acetyl-ADP-ribose deacetylase (regulator of RNase III)
LKLHATTGDITRLRVDVVVNAANPRLLGGGGVDGAIHRAAGPELLKACRRIGGCAPGEARLTPGYRLPATWVAHAVGPVWQGGRAGEPELLAACYQSALALAAANDARSIAFPAISCGVYGYPADAACRIAVETLSAWTGPLPEEAWLVAFDDRIRAVYEKLLGAPAVRPPPLVRS